MAESSRKARPARVVRVRLSAAKHGPEPIMGAAYLMMDRAFVLLEGSPRRALTVVLRPKPGRDAAAVEAAFRAEYEAQKVRWELARRNQPIREYVVENAVRLANEPAAAPAAAPSDELSPEQRSEIDRLIAEVEAEIKDMNRDKAVADPKGVAEPWEAKGGGAPREPAP